MKEEAAEAIRAAQDARCRYESIGLYRLAMDSLKGADLGHLQQTIGTIDSSIPRGRTKGDLCQNLVTKSETRSEFNKHLNILMQASSHQ